MKLYETREWKGYGKSCFWNEYWLKDNVITKFKCSRTKFFDGKENVWSTGKKVMESWKIGSSIIPEWLKKIVPKVKK